MLLRFPLFYKILVANVALVALAVGVGTYVAVSWVRSGAGAVPETGLLALGMAAVGSALTFVLNAALVRSALRPLEDLASTAQTVSSQQRLDVRVPVSPLADRKMVRLIRVFNGMLDNLTQHRARLRELTVRALEAVEQERRRVAKFLHEDTAQRLATSLVRLQVARRGRDPADLEEALEEVRDQLVDSLDTVREVARSLHPPELEEIGVDKAIRAHARAAVEPFGIRLELDAEPVDACLDQRARLALYRIVQEALDNVGLHADATRVRVRIRHDPGLRRVVTVVEDDGNGFHAAPHPEIRPDTLGLFAMKERAGYVSGELEVQSEPGAGTRVRVTIPCTDEAHGA